VTLDFLSPVPGPTAASPLEPWLRAAGASFETRHGWRVAAALGSPDEEAEACRSGVGIADRSGMGKLELQARPDTLAAELERMLAGGGPSRGETARLEDGLIWRSSPDRALAVCEPGATERLRARLDGAGCGLVDLTAGYAAFELRGPVARDLLERLTAIDVRPAALPPGAVRPGVVARVAATLVCLAPEAFLILVSTPEARDAWDIVLDAGAPLGLRAVGEEARARA
jgi:heterotetrameric sarcosine oxidase gamma subunit